MGSFESGCGYIATAAICQTIAGGKRRIDFADFKAYFKKAQPCCGACGESGDVGPSALRQKCLKKRWQQIASLHCDFTQK